MWTNAHLLCTQLIENVIVDTKEDFKEADASIRMRSIQYWDAGSIGFLKRMHPDIDVHNLQAFLSAALKKSHPSIELKLGLKIKTPWNRKKLDATENANFKNRIQAVHLQCEGKRETITAKVIKIILTSTVFQQRCKCDASLIPDFDKNSDPFI